MKKSFVPFAVIIAVALIAIISYYYTQNRKEEELPKIVAALKSLDTSVAYYSENPGGEVKTDPQLGGSNFLKLTVNGSYKPEITKLSGGIPAASLNVAWWVDPNPSDGWLYYEIGGGRYCYIEGEGGPPPFKLTMSGVPDVRWGGKYTIDDIKAGVVGTKSFTVGGEEGFYIFRLTCWQYRANDYRDTREIWVTVQAWVTK